MALQQTPVTSSLIVVIAINVVGAGVAWRQRQGPTELLGASIQLTLLLWSGLLLLTVSVESLQAKLFFLSLFFPTIPLLSAGALCFAAHFTGRSEWLTPRRQLLIGAYPTAFLLLSITNHVHGLFLTDPELTTRGSWTVVTYQWGPLFWTLPLIAYSLAAVYLSWLTQQFVHSRNVYRKLSFVILLINAGIVGATIPSTFQVSPLPHFLLAPHVQLVLGGVVVLVTGSVRFARIIPIDRLVRLVGSQFGDVVSLARDYVVEEIDNGILVLDGDDRVVDVNDTAKKMLGVDRPVGNQLTEITQPEVIEDPGRLEPILTGETPVHEVEESIWLQTPAGRRCYEVRVSALAENGDTAGHVVLLHDMTAQKRRQQRLEDREAELETQKAELERQNEQLEHQNERLDQFASIVSHDLRNPLNVANGYVEALEHQLQELPQDAAVDETLVTEVHHSHQRMEAIIEDALTLARQGKAITETEPVALDTLIDEAWSNVDTKAATLEADLELVVEGDRNRLLNVFENLFRNAVQHGGAEVTVVCGDCSEPDTTGFYVADDGGGIPDGELDEVLEHGYTTHEEGTGLGLSIVADIVRAHGWTIEVRNAATGGARFDVTGVSTHSTPVTSTTEQSVEQ